MGASSSTGSNIPRRNDDLISAGEIYVNRYPFCKLCSYLRAGFGVVTAIAIFFAAVDAFISITYIPCGIYLTILGLPITLLEFGYIIRMCCGTTGACCRTFSLVLDFDRWKRGVFYCLFSFVLFLPNFSTLYSNIAGGLLFATGVLYASKTCQKKKVQMYVLNPNLPANPRPNYNTNS